MALINLQQTDTDAGCATSSYCSGNSNNSVHYRRQATSGGAAGSGSVTSTLDSSASDANMIWFDCPIPAGASWDAGTWTIRLNVTSGNHQLTLDEIHICRLSSGCANQGSIGSSVTIGQNMSAAQVYSFNVTGSAQTPSVDDLVHVILAFDNAQAMTQDITWSPSEIINTPFDDGATGGTVQDPIMAGILPFAR